jgi:transposase-like protein
MVDEGRKQSKNKQGFAGAEPCLAHGANSVLSLLTAAPEGGVLKRDPTRGTEISAMDFSLIDYLDEDACYAKLVDLLHPDGLACPRCGERQRLGIHRCHRTPVLDYQCATCGRVFNAWTETVLQGVQRSPAHLLMILHGIAQGTPTAQMARQLGRDRRHLLALRHRLQELARIGLDRNPLGDRAVEADEMDQNAGEKRDGARRPRRPAAAACQQSAGSRHL